MCDEKIRVLMIGPMGMTGGVANHTRSLKAELEKYKEIKLTLYNCSPEHSIHLIQNVRKYLARKFLLTRYLEKNGNRFDIIHAQSSGGMPAFWTAQTVADFRKRNDITFIMTFHHGDTAGFLQRHLKEVEPVMRTLDHLILVSNFQKDIFKKYFPWFDSITVIPNGYSGDLFRSIPKGDVRNRLEIPLEKKVLLSVGNLEKVKGYRHLVEAMGLIHKRGSDVVCYIIGEGAERKRLEKQINHLGLEGIVNLVGAKLHDEIPFWMNACDIFILPSLKEGNPTVMFEALACGKPFIGTTVGGIPEIIRDEKLGILVPPKDYEALAKAILKGLERKWDANYIMKYAKQFTWKKIAKQIIDLYSEFINS